MYAATGPRSLPGVAIRWFTDADRQDMRDAAEESRVLNELVRWYDPPRVMTPEERDEAVKHPRPMWNGPPIDPNRGG